MTNSSSLETSYRGNPHDMLARTALQIPQIFSELVEVLLSEEALIHLDFDSVTTLPTDYHDQQGRLRQIDALGQINVRTKKSQDSHPQKLIVICEHKSTAQKNTLKQIGHYVKAIMNSHSDAWVLPVIIYNGRKRWPHELQYVLPIDLMPAPLANQIGTEMLRYHIKARLIDVTDPKLLTRTKGMAIDIIFDALRCGRNANDNDIYRLLVKLTEQPVSIYKKIWKVVMYYITQVQPDYDFQRLHKIEQQVLEEQGGKMKVEFFESKIMTVEEMIRQDLLEELTPKLKEELTSKLKKELTSKLKRELTPKLKEELTPKLKEELTPKLKEELTPRLKEELTPKLKIKIRRELEEELTPKLEKKIRQELEEELRNHKK